MTLSRFSKNSIALAAVCLAALMFGLEISSVPVILPTLEKVLHGDLKDMQWIMNAYTIACTTVLMASGTLADRFGRKLLFVISVIIFGITSLICGFAQSAPVLIGSRFLQGLGGGAMIVTQIGILSHQFQDARERGRAFGIWGIVFGTGLGFGPIIGGAIVAVSNWQWVFLIHVLLSVLTLVLVYGSVTESRDPEAKKLDSLGIITLSLAVFGLTYFIIQGRDFGFTSSTGIAIIVGAACCLGAFLLVERLNSHPMFDFSVFRIRNFSGAIMGSMGMNFSFWPFMIYLPIYFQIGLGYDSVAAGLALLAYTLPTLLVPPFGERLALRYQPRIVIPLGMFTIGLGFILMRFGGSFEHASWLSMLPGALLAGTGLGLTNTPVTNTTTGSVSSDRAGMASGIDLSARLISLAINIAVMGFILVEGVSSYLRSSLAAALDPDQLHRLAERVASGEIAAAQRSLAELSHVVASDAPLHAALMHGFSLVMLYGAVCIWLLAATSYLIFGSRRAAAHAAASGMASS